MLYFLFGKRTLKKKFIRRLEAMRKQTYPVRTEELAQKIAAENPAVGMDAKMLCKIADTNLFTNTTQEYFPLGEDMVAKIFLMLVFVAIDVIVSVAAKQKAWLCLCGSLGACMLLFTMVSMITPLGFYLYEYCSLPCRWHPV